MKPLILLLLLAVARACAVDHEIFRATISLPLVNAVFENDKDLFVTTRAANKQLISLATGLPFKTAIPKGVILALAIPQGGTPFTSPRLVVFNTKTSVVTRTIATFTASNILVPDDLKKPSAALVTANFTGMSNGEFTTAPFTLTGSGSGVALAATKGPALTLKLDSLRGEFSRSHPTSFFYAGFVLKASLRVSGKPVATVNL